MHAQTDYTPKHTGNSTITTQGMPTVILQVLFKKEETDHFCKRRKTNQITKSICPLIFVNSYS